MYRPTKAKAPQEKEKCMACLHVHDHSGLTSCSREHCHLHPGVTSPPIYCDGSHYHEIWGATSYDRGHHHVYYAVTGPAIPLPHGYHTHYTVFKTSFDLDHEHQVAGFVQGVKEE